MKIAKIDENICDRSPFCPAGRSCRFGAFNVEMVGFFQVKINIDENKCTGCSVCTRYCPHGAIKLIDKAS